MKPEDIREKNVEQSFRTTITHKEKKHKRIKKINPEM